MEKLHFAFMYVWKEKKNENKEINIEIKYFFKTK